ncbi:MAG: 2-hydroxyacid dehydrogenase [Clostridia bacterium]|nr:2-hydroxyacid dehydrogenase [Clostridia bacterium]
MSIRFAFFDAKPYDIAAFEPHIGQDIRFKFFETKLNADTAELAHGFDGVCIFVNDTADAEVIDHLCEAGVKLIALRCAGFNNVDLKHAAGKLTVVRVPAYSPHAVAEHAMAMLLCVLRKVHRAYIRTRDFNFSLNGLTGFELHGRTMGVVGTGRIGREFIRICKGFGMKILAYDKFPAKDADFDYVPLNELLAGSDIISLHCPLTDDTYHIIDADAIARMKKGVVLINTSRGALVDADALLEGIKARQVGAACLDVYEEESDIFFEDYSGHIVQDDTLARLIYMPNVIVTSHQAFLTDEALSAIAATTISNIREFFADGKCQNEISYKKQG